MKQRFWKAIGGAGMAILVLVIYTQVWVTAHASDNNDQDLVGSWDVSVTPRDCQTGDPIPFLPTFSAVQTYHKGGTMLASNLGTPGSTNLEGHGVWSHERGRRYSIAFRVIKFNPDGTYAGKDVIRDSIRLGINGNSYTSTGVVEIFDPAGNMIVRGCATTVGTRFE